MSKLIPNSLVGSNHPGNVKRKFRLMKKKIKIIAKPVKPAFPSSWDRYGKDEIFKMQIDTLTNCFSKKETGSILVVDCWDGFVCSKIVSTGFGKVAGIEIDPMAVAVAREKVKQVEFVNADYMVSPMDFDYIIAIDPKGRDGIAGLIDKAWAEARKGIFIAIKISGGDEALTEMCEDDFKEMVEGLEGGLFLVRNDGKNIYLEVTKREQT